MPVTRTLPDRPPPVAGLPRHRAIVAGHRYPGWVHTPYKTAQLHVTDIASYKQTA